MVFKQSFNFKIFSKKSKDKIVYRLTKEGTHTL